MKRLAIALVLCGLAVAAHARYTYKADGRDGNGETLLEVIVPSPAFTITIQNVLTNREQSFPDLDKVVMPMRGTSQAKVTVTHPKYGSMEKVVQVEKGQRVTFTVLWREDAQAAAPAAAAGPTYIGSLSNCSSKNIRAEFMRDNKSVATADMPAHRDAEDLKLAAGNYTIRRYEDGGGGQYRYVPSNEKPLQVSKDGWSYFPGCQNAAPPANSWEAVAAANAPLDRSLLIGIWKTGTLQNQCRNRAARFIFSVNGRKAVEEQVEPGATKQVTILSNTYEVFSFASAGAEKKATIKVFKDNWRYSHSAC